MATKGFNFRSTSGYVTDAGNDTYVTGDTYPTTRNGVTFGWTTGPDKVRDRNNGVNAKVAGCNLSDSTTDVFQVDMSGSLKVRMAFGDAGSGQLNCSCDLRDSAGSKFTIGPVSPSAEQFYDATGSLHTSAANWVSSNAQSTAYTFSSYVEWKLIAASGQDSPAAHLELEEQAGTTTARLIEGGLINGGKLLGGRLIA